MSLTNPNSVVTEERLHEYHQEILPYLGGSADAGFTPVGTVISVMGVTAPANYLACNGQTVNISDYPELATYFEQQFGSKNKFGGNGTTTFAVPDLRGEFLRGTGTNSHTDQGSGAAVGTHQDGTKHINFGYIYDSKLISIKTDNTGSSSKYAVDADTSSTTSEGFINITGTNGTNTSSKSYFTSRPTNTSVLFCIATKNIYLNPSLDYSTDEKVVGTWIDGKTIYQRTFVDTAPSTATNGTIAEKYITIGASIDKVMSIKSIRDSGGYAWGEFPLTNPPTITTDTISSKTVVTSVVNLMMMTFVLDNNATSNANKIRVTNNCVAWNDIPIYVTIQYTKTY